MNSEPLVFERLYKAPASKVWKAITDKDEMKAWYFNLAEFRPEVGFAFQFKGGPAPERQYVHLCQITEVIPEKKLTYSWAYEGSSGKSFVTFELEAQGENTLLTLTHAGLDTFPKNNPDFDSSNFQKGWTHILHTSLKKYLEPANSQDYVKSIQVNATPKAVYESLTQRITGWWSENFEGAAATVGDEFTVRFGSTYKTIRVEETVPNEKVVWLCTDPYINSPALKNKAEWKDTRMVWEIAPEGTQTKVKFTHIGLNPSLECFEMCEKGWDYYIEESLRPYLNSGVGVPQKK